MVFAWISWWHHGCSILQLELVMCLIFAALWAKNPFAIVIWCWILSLLTCLLFFWSFPLFFAQK
jgi:hypothetical protein